MQPDPRDAPRQQVEEECRVLQRIRARVLPEQRRLLALSAGQPGSVQKWKKSRLEAPLTQSEEEIIKNAARCSDSRASFFSQRGQVRGFGSRWETAVVSAQQPHQHGESGIRRDGPQSVYPEPP